MCGSILIALRNYAIGHDINMYFDMLIRVDHAPFEFSPLIVAITFNRLTATGRLHVRIWNIPRPMFSGWYSGISGKLQGSDAINLVSAKG